MKPTSLVYNSDCLAGMREMSDNAYQLAIVDPPYNVKRNYNEYKDDKSDSEYATWCSEWFKELQRVSETIVMTCGTKNLKFWMNKDPKHVIIWSKPNQCSPSPLGGFNAYEPVLFWGKLHKRIGHDLFTTNIKMQADAAFHNCPKDLQSWKKLIGMCIDAPAKVLDPFLGSGTSRLACAYLGLDFTGFELDSTYFKAQEKRFQLSIQQQSIF